MMYKLLTKNIDGIQIIARIDDDGLCRLTCTEDNPEYVAWLELGNTPLSADSLEPADL